MTISKVCVIRGPGVIAPYVADSYARAFEKLGIGVFVFDDWGLRDQPDALAARFRALQDWRPQLAVSYGHVGFLRAPTGPAFRQLGVPLAMLYYDCPFFMLDDEKAAEFRQYPESYFHFIWDKTFLALYREQGVAHCHPILLAADPDTFAPATAAYRYDVTFVGSGGDTVATARARWKRFSPTINLFIEQVITRKVASPSTPVLDIWAQVASNQFPSLLPNWSQPETADIYMAIHQEGLARLRRSLLQGIQTHRPDVFGTDWNGLGLASHPSVDYERELPTLYAASRINLNISAPQLEQSINNRVFDVAAVGGFLLTDYRADLAEVFPAAEAISYHSAAELNDKIGYYLSHEEERRRLAQALHEAVLAKHTYVHRAQYMLDVVNATR